MAVSPSHPLEGQHIVFAANQPEYNPLQVWRKPTGEVISRWRLTWRERIAALMGRPLYLEVLTFNRPLQPVYLTFSEHEALYANEPVTEE